MNAIRKYELSFIRKFFAASLIILLLSFYPIYIYASRDEITSFLYGYIISAANVLTGFGLIELSAGGDIKKFMALIFGGMFVRIFLSAALLIVLISFAGADAKSLVGSFFFFYIVFTVMEIQFVHKKKI